MKTEYHKRHNEIWPQLKQLLHDAGIREYSIFFDEGTHSLFAVLQAADPALLDALPSREVMQDWWRHMAPIMETNTDSSPVSTRLEEVFYMP